VSKSEQTTNQDPGGLIGGAYEIRFLAWNAGGYYFTQRSHKKALTQWATAKNASLLI
jgi:hypothetical protein